MTRLTLRPMTKAEYNAWRPQAVGDYAEHHVRAGSMPADQANTMAEKQFTDLLPDGPVTAEHHLLVADLDGRAVGFLWLNIPTDSDTPSTFIYDVQVDKTMRGQGLGRELMIAGENYARKRGATSMRLHVFGNNTVARRLYESIGYSETNVMMAKSLGPAD